MGVMAARSVSSVRTAIGVVAFAAAACGGWLGADAALDWAGVATPDVDIDVMGPLTRTLERLRAPAPRRRRSLAYFGDSLSVSYPPGRRVPEQLAARASALSGRGHHFAAFAFATPGFTPFEFYFLAHDVALAQPDIAVIALNLSAFSDVWRHGFARPALAGWIPPEELPSALSLPLAWIGLGPDRLLLNVGIVRGGCFEAWRSVLDDSAPMDIPDFRKESVRKKYAKDDWSPDPARRRKGQPPSSILGEIKPTKEGKAFAKKIWADQGYFE